MYGFQQYGSIAYSGLLITAQDLSQILSDNFLFDETSINRVSKINTESFVLSEFFLKRNDKKNIENISFTEILSKTTILTNSDILNFSETISRIIETNRYFLESVLFSDTNTETTSLKFSENISFTEEQIFAFRKNLVNSINLLETFSILNSIKFSESLSITESVFKIINKMNSSNLDLNGSNLFSFEKILSSNLELIENYSKLIRRPVGDTLNFLEILLSVSGSQITLSDIINFTEIFLKRIQLSKTSNFNLIDFFTRLFSVNRSFIESLNLLEELTKYLQISKTTGLVLIELLGSESKISVTDSVALNITLLKSLGLSESENLTISEDLKKRTTKYLEESEELTESLTRSISYLKDFLDNFQITEIEDTISFFTIDVFDSFDLIDNKTILNQKNFSSTVVFIESHLNESIKKTSENLNLSESFSKHIYIDSLDNLNLASALQREFRITEDESLALIEHAVLQRFERTLPKTYLFSKHNKI